MDGVTRCRECGKSLPRERFEGRDHVLKFPPMLRAQDGRILTIHWRLCEGCAQAPAPRPGELREPFGAPFGGSALSAGGRRPGGSV